MYVIWNSRKLYLWDTAAGWTGGTPAASPAGRDDTSCHRSHVHISLSWRGASRQDTWWTLATESPLHGSGAEQACSCRENHRSIAPSPCSRHHGGGDAGRPAVPVRRAGCLTVSGGRVPWGSPRRSRCGPAVKQSTWVALGRRWRGTGTTAIDTRLSVSPAVGDDAVDRPAGAVGRIRRPRARRGRTSGSAGRTTGGARRPAGVCQRHCRLRRESRGPSVRLRVRRRCRQVVRCADGPSGTGGPVG